MTLDQTLPSAALSAPADGAYLTTGLTLMGTASDAHLTSYRLEVAPASAPEQWSVIAQGAAPVENGALGQWRALPPDGVYQLRLSVTDAADNTVQVLRRVTIDTRPPLAPAALQGRVDNAQIELTWAASLSEDVKGMTSTATASGSQRRQFLISPTLTRVATEGRYAYTVVAVDHAGLRSQPSVSGRKPVGGCDAAAGAPHCARIWSDGPWRCGNSGAAYSRDDFKVYRVLIGENAPSASLHLLRRSPVPMQADVLAYWSTLGLKEGAAYRIVLEAEDINGNVATAQVVVTVDNQAPAIPVGLTANVLGADVNLSWRASRETDLLGYVVYRQRQPLPSGAVTGDLRSIAIAAAAYTDQGVTDGTRDYAVAAVDQAGNVSALSAPVTVHVDTRAPHAVITQPRDGATFDASVYLLATVADQDVQHVQFAYKTALTSIWNPLDRADHAAPYEAFFDAAALGLDYGVYELTALATDAANQTDSAPSTIRVTYTDLTGPEPVEGVTVSVDGDAAHVRWVANREADLAGYHIERRTGDGAFSRLTDEPLTQLHYVDRELADAAYDYAVIAVDAYGNISAAARVGPATVYTPRLEQPHTPTMALSTLLSGQGITTATVAGEVQSDHGSQAIQQVNTDADGRFTIADLPLERAVRIILRCE